MSTPQESPETTTYADGYEDDTLFPPVHVITVVDVTFVEGDVDDECHVYDLAGVEAASCRPGNEDGNLAGYSIACLPQVAGHSDPALVARALTGQYQNGASIFRVLGIPHRAVTAVCSWGGVPPTLAELEHAISLEIFDVTTFSG